MGVRLWTEESNICAVSDDKPRLHGAAAFADRNRGVFWLHCKGTLTNIQSLKWSPEGVLLHHIWKSMVVVEHLLVRDIGMGLIEIVLHLSDSLVMAWLLLLSKREEWWVIGHLLESSIVTLIGVHNFACCNLEPLDFMFQCLVQRCRDIGFSHLKQ